MRSVRELAGYFARSGAADDEVDARLTERNESREAGHDRRDRESEEACRQYAEFISEIEARGGPRDEVERMIWEARTKD